MIMEFEVDINSLSEFEIFNERDHFEKAYFMLIKARFTSLKHQIALDSESKTEFVSLTEEYFKKGYEYGMNLIPVNKLR